MEKYQVLSTVFDGVPKPWPDSLKKDTFKLANKIEKKDDKTSNNAAVIYFHKPYEQRVCSKCHEKGNSLRLVAQIPELCYLCHEDYHNKYKVLHGPLEVGTCSNCHNPHQSEHKILLTRKGQDLCLFCHDRTDINKTEIHKSIGDKDCWSCHNPHGGADRRFMK
jgi:predicted CXXCH cytochrome family protein